VLSANNWFFVVNYLAITGVGAVMVPLNPGSPGAEVTRQVAAVGARSLIVGPSGRAAAERLDRAACGPNFEQVVAPERVGVPGAQTLESFFPAAPTPIVDREPDDLAVLMFTSGTGGAPKAAMLSHGNLRSNLEQIQGHPGRRLTPSDVSLGVLPLFHIFGLNVILGLSLYAGGSVVLVERFDPATALETIANHRVTFVAGAPPMFASWLALDQADPGAFASVRLLVSGAAALTAAISERFEERFGISINQGYGLTEASPAVTSSVVGGQVKHGSVGVPLPGIEVRLVDAAAGGEEDALEGDPGEVWVRGPNVFRGYWEDAGATSGVLTADGWLRTGDVGVADSDGYLYLVDRAKDVIIVSGFNVYPAEVEEALAAHPGVAEVAVVSVPHPHTGEAVKAFVVPVAGHHIEEDELIEWCEGRVARYKCPSKIMFVPELPRGAGGKVLRRALV
jgi:long-chain acyl-CoA synthetase